MQVRSDEGHHAMNTSNQCASINRTVQKESSATHRLRYDQDRRVAFKLFSCIQLTSSRHASKAIAPSAAALRSIAVVLAALLDDNDDKEEEFNAGEYDEVDYGDDGEDEDDDDDGKCEDPSAAAAALK